MSIFTNKNHWILIQISSNFILNRSTDNKSTVVCIMTWRKSSNKLLPEPMMTEFTDVYTTFPASVASTFTCRFKINYHKSALIKGNFLHFTNVWTASYGMWRKSISGYDIFLHILAKRSTFRFIICRSFTLCNAVSLQWRHNERNGVSNHQPHDYLLNCLFRRR